MRERHGKLPVVVGTAILALTLAYMSAFGGQFPQVDAKGVPAPIAGQVDYTPEVSIEEVTNAPDDPEFSNQQYLFNLAGGTQEQYVQAVDFYTQMWALAHPTSTPPTPGVSDPNNRVAILGSGLGAPDGATPSDFTLDTAIDHNAPLARDYTNFAGPNTFDYAQSSGTSQLMSPFAIANNGTAFTGISPYTIGVIPMVTRHGADTVIAQTGALERALAQFAKHSESGASVVVVDGSFTTNLASIRDSVDALAARGVYVVLNSANRDNPLNPNPVATDAAIHGNVFVVGGDTTPQPTGAQTDTLASDFNVRTFSNGSGEISTVSGNEMAVSQIAVILNMAQQLRPEGAAVIPVARMKELIAQYGNSDSGVFTNLEGLMYMVAIEYGLIDPPPTPTPSSTPSPSPSPSSTPSPSPSPSSTPSPSPSPTATPIPEFKVYMPFIQRLQDIAHAVIGVGR